jgi:hypothetical protein
MLDYNYYLSFYAKVIITSTSLLRSNEQPIISRFFGPLVLSYIYKTITLTNHPVASNLRAIHTYHQCSQAKDTNAQPLSPTMVNVAQLNHLVNTKYHIQFDIMQNLDHPIIQKYQNHINT